jgi:hypothetical protein
MGVELLTLRYCGRIRRIALVRLAKVCLPVAPIFGTTSKNARGPAARTVVLWRSNGNLLPKFARSLSEISSATRLLNQDQSALDRRFLSR